MADKPYLWLILNAGIWPDWEVKDVQKPKGPFNKVLLTGFMIVELILISVHTYTFFVHYPYKI